MISRMVENAVFWINALPVNSGMSYKISPWTLITGTTIYFKRHWKIEFVVYAEAHKKTFPCNSTRSCTEPAICIGSTVNLQGYYWFLNLRTGWHIKQYTFNPLSIPTQCIYSVHAIADADNHNPALDFLNAWVILSHIVTPPAMTIKTTPDISQEWRKTTTKWKSQEWQHQIKRISHEWHHQNKKKFQEWQHQKRKRKFQRWTYQKKKTSNWRLQE